jgi:hypothetical protein
MDALVERHEEASCLRNKTQHEAKREKETTIVIREVGSKGASLATAQPSSAYAQMVM